MEESDNFLTKPCCKRARMERSEKARKKRAQAKRKRNKEHDEHYYGNLNDD